MPRSCISAGATDAVNGDDGTPVDLWRYALSITVGAARTVAPRESWSLM